MNVTMEELFGDQKVDYKCDECGHLFSFSFKNVLKKSIIACPKCHVKIDLGEDEFQEMLNGMQEEIDDFNKDFKNF